MKNEIWCTATNITHLFLLHTIATRHGDKCCKYQTNRFMHYTM